MVTVEEYRVKRAAGHPVCVKVPGSKSITNRALLIAALAEGVSTLENVLFSDDSRHFLEALKVLGFPVTVDEAKRRVTITGYGGRIPKKKAEIDVGSAGTAARFLTAYLGLSEGEYHMVSSEQMRKRPMGELLDALRQLGAVVRFDGESDHFPFTIGCPLRQSYEVTIDVDKSSQFLSALLISSVLFDGDFVIHVKGQHGMAYVEMTVALMEQFGVSVIRSSNTFRIPKNARYCSGNYRIEPDVSAAAYFYAMCPILKVPVQVTGVHWNSLQGDTSFLHVLEKMGCRSDEKEEGICLLPPENGMHGGEFDLSAFSDQALTLAAIACFAKEPVTITGIGHIRYQECDRIQAILVNLKSMGISCYRKDEGSIVIEPGTPKGCRIQTFEDHRVAMAFSLPGLVTDGIVIENPMCCRKTFETYFEVLEEAVCR